MIGECLVAWQVRLVDSEEGELKFCPYTAKKETMGRLAGTRRQEPERRNLSRTGRSYS